jgi:hypothetical protein
MKYLTPVLVGGAAITAAVTTAIAQAHGVFNGHASLMPYLYAYGASAVLLLLAVAMAIHAGRQESKTTADDKHKNIKTRLAALMRQAREIHASLKEASDNTEYTKLVGKAADWEHDVISLLNEAELPTDAEMFHQVGYAELSSEQLARLSHVPEWKRHVIARFLLHYQTLDQIRSNRRL